MPAFSAVIARNLRAERHRVRLTQTQLGQKIGWSAQMVSESETGQRKLGVDDLPLLCQVFDITLAQLATGADEAHLRALGI